MRPNVLAISRGTRCFPSAHRLPPVVARLGLLLPFIFTVIGSPNLVNASENLRRHSYTTHVDAVTHQEDGNSSNFKATTSKGKERLEKLEASSIAAYGRIRNHHGVLTCKQFAEEYSHVQSNETLTKRTIEIRGRIIRKRLQGKKLLFLDVIENGVTLQAMVETQKIHISSDSRIDLENILEALRPGDITSITGHPHRTARGELSIRATQSPELLVPCLHSHALWDSKAPETKSGERLNLERHVEYLLKAKSKQTIQNRFLVIKRLKQFFDGRDFLEVSTPILSRSAGGAVARAFETKATEFGDRKLSLRIAPELWLKRLIIGGFQRIYEVGPSFRNEGLDKTHNPEFWTCEFYQTFTTLPELMQLTREMLASLFDSISSDAEKSPYLETISSLTSEFETVEFIPSLESALGHCLPPLHASSATSSILDIFHQRGLTPPDHANLPRLLDKLSSLYLEPRSLHKPTFIIHPPECLSPLSKSFTDKNTHQIISARAELFITGMEIANMYEEENSPVEQRRKFEMQARLSGAAQDDVSIDEDYIRALEWGLPPTGGWGCGLDRLVMLLTGSEKIGDVLPFGNLRAVTREGGS